MFLDEFETIIFRIEQDSNLNFEQKRRRLSTLRYVIYCKNPEERIKCSNLKSKCPNITYY